MFRNRQRYCESVPADGAAAGGTAATTAPAAPVPSNLIDAAAPAPGATPAPAAPPDAANEWFLAEGVKGTGERPDYLKPKYKTLADQAKAYVDAEKRFGTFVGAPEGDYKLSLPEGIEGEFDAEHPLLKEFTDWGKKNQLSQEGFEHVLHLFAKYEAANTSVDWNQVKAQIGNNADSRITNVMDWAKANLPADQAERLKAVLAPSASPADTFQLIESLIGKTRQVAMPKPGDDTTTSGLTLADVEAAQNKIENGQRLFDTDPAYREKVRRMRAQVVGNEPHQEVIGRR